jgi:hypothetical protein
MACIKGCLGALQHCYFYVVFYRVFFCRHQGVAISFQEQKTESIYHNLSYYLFNVLKTLFWHQKCYTLLCAQLKKTYSLFTREREEISQKFQRILIQQAKSILCKKSTKKSCCTILKNLNTFTANISVLGQNLKNKNGKFKIT